MAPDPDTPAVSYRAAADELEQILADLDDDHLDVDVLADKVRRAAELIAFCRSRISSARMEVEQIVADLDQVVDEPADPLPGLGGNEAVTESLLEPAAEPPTEPPSRWPSPDGDPTLVGPFGEDPTLVVDQDDVTATDRPTPPAPAGS